MPLHSGKDAIGSNISEMIASPTFGRRKTRKKRIQMAQAAALSKAFGPLQSSKKKH